MNNLLHILIICFLLNFFSIQALEHAKVLFYGIGPTTEIFRSKELYNNKDSPQLYEIREKEYGPCFFCSKITWLSQFNTDIRSGGK